MTKNSSRNRRSALRTFTTGDGGRLTPGDGGRRRAGVPLPRGSDGDRTVAATRNVRGAVVGDGAGAGAFLAGRFSGAHAAAAGDCPPGLKAAYGCAPVLTAETRAMTVTGAETGGAFEVAAGACDVLCPVARARWDRGPRTGITVVAPPGGSPR